MLIYKITNTQNDKSYIGITSTDLETRFNAHKKDAKYNTGYRLHSAIRKYGEDAFTIEVIAEADTKEAALDLETDWIRRLNTVDAGYNCNYGGTGLVYHTDESKAKMSENNYWKGKRRNGELNPMHGRSHTDEAKAKIGASTKEYLANNPHGMLGKTHSEETRNKISESLKGKTSWNKGIPMSEESINKQRASRQKYSTKSGSYQWKINIDGEDHIITNLKKYCSDNDLNYTKLRAVATKTAPAQYSTEE